MLSARLASPRVRRLIILLAAVSACAHAAPSPIDAPTASDRAVTAPCTSTDACIERLALNGGTLPIYRTYALASAAPVTRAVIVVHGAGRDAAGEFAAMVDAARAMRALGSTVVIAPLFQVDPKAPCLGKTDAPASGDLYWGCDAPHDWKIGQPAVRTALSSFAALDAVLASVEKRFASVSEVTFVGFSAGGQLVQRFAALRSGATDRAKVRYVIGDPGSWMYLDNRRLRAGIECSDTLCSNLDSPSFAPPEGTACGSTYDTYKYGLTNVAAALGAYGRTVSTSAVAATYASRDVDYLIAAKDEGAKKGSAFGVLDVSCEADLQGPMIRGSHGGEAVTHSYRAARAATFHRYVTTLFHANHTATVVPGCAHDAACVFGTDEARTVIFRSP